MAIRYKQHEGGPWVPFPWQFGRISVRTFLHHIEYEPKGEIPRILFHYGGTPLHVFAVQFVDPFMGVRGDDKNVFDAGAWSKTGFTTGWRDELSDWEKL